MPRAKISRVANLRATRRTRAYLALAQDAWKCTAVREELVKDGYEPDEAVLTYLKHAKRELDALIHKLTEELASKHKEATP